MDRTRMQRRAIKLKFKEKRDMRDNTGQTHSARHWKAPRR
jgi:hypothetical protein